MRVGMLFCCLVLAAAPAGAAVAPDSQAQKVYEGLMSDGDLYVGEGLVTLATYGGDLAKAKAAAHERARGNLAEAIRVRVVSRTTDTQRSDGKTSQESVEAVSSSSSDLELQDVQYKALEGYPKEGQLTVVAFLSKEEFKRQQDQRVLAYRPNRGLRLWGGSHILAQLDDDGSTYGQLPAGLTAPVNSSSSGSGMLSFGADIYFKSFFFGAGLTSGGGKAYVYDPKNSQAMGQPSSGGYVLRDKPFSVTQLHLGYEWTPWATRFQVVFPIQLEYALLSWDPYYASNFGAAAGLTLRYWAVDRVAFDLGGRWHQGFGSSNISTPDGIAMRYRPTVDATFNLSGPELSIGALWNGF